MRKTLDKMFQKKGPLTAAVTAAIIGGFAIFYNPVPKAVGFVQPHAVVASYNLPVGDVIEIDRSSMQDVDSTVSGDSTVYRGRVSFRTSYFGRDSVYRTLGSFTILSGN